MTYAKNNNVLEDLMNCIEMERSPQPGMAFLQGPGGNKVASIQLLYQLHLAEYQF